jgi:hypothetical protein
MYPVDREVHLEFLVLLKGHKAFQPSCHDCIMHAAIPDSKRSDIYWGFAERITKITDYDHHHCGTTIGVIAVIPISPAAAPSSTRSILIRQSDLANQ